MHFFFILFKNSDVFHPNASSETNHNAKLNRFLRIRLRSLLKAFIFVFIRRRKNKAIKRILKWKTIKSQKSNWCCAIWFLPILGEHCKANLRFVAHLSTERRIKIYYLSSACSHVHITENYIRVWGLRMIKKCNFLFLFIASIIFIVSSMKFKNEAANRESWSLRFVFSGDRLLDGWDICRFSRNYDAVVGSLF